MEKTTLHRARRRYLAVAVVSVLAVIVVLAAGWRAVPDAPFGQTRRLANGASISLVGVTEGIRHAFDGRSPWDKLVELTGHHSSRLRRFSWRTGRDCLVVWFRVRGDRHLHASLWARYDLILTDPRGNVLRAWELKGWAPSPHGRREDWYAVAFPVYPRAARWWTLTLREQPDFRAVASFQVRNPHPASYRRRKTEPYPVVRRTPDVSFTLRRIVSSSTQPFGVASTAFTN